VQTICHAPEFAGLEIAGLENNRQHRRVEKSRTGIWQTGKRRIANC